MRIKLRSWKFAVPLGVLLAAGAAIAATTAAASRSAGVIKIAVSRSES